MKTHSKPLEKDFLETTYISYFLATENFHSMDGITPSNYREPFLSFLNAINILRLSPKKNQIAKEELVNDPELILEMTKLNLVYLILIYGLSYILSRKLELPRFLASVAAFIPVFFFSIFTSYITSVNSELPSSILLLLFSIFIILFFEQRKIRFLIFSGLTIGLLALTKAVFFYLFILLIPTLYLLDRFTSKECTVLGTWPLLVLTFSFFLPVGSWMIRNYIQLGSTSISDRGGEVLLIRAIKNQMSDEEYWGAFYAYGPEALQSSVFEKFLGYKKEDLLDGGKLQRLNRGLLEDTEALKEGRYEDVKSYYRIAQVEHRNLISKYGQIYVDSNPDQGSKYKGLNLIIANPWNHLKASLLFSWRGIWFYKGRYLIPVIVTFFMYYSLFYVFGLSLIKKNQTLFWITSLPILYFMFHAFFTHFIPRYSGNLVPFLAVTLVYFLNTYIMKFKSFYPTKIKK